MPSASFLASPIARGGAKKPHRLFQMIFTGLWHLREVPTLQQVVFPTYQQPRTPLSADMMVQIPGQLDPE